MKKNGFTILEVIVAFTITMVVVLFLFQIVVSLKNLFLTDYSSSEILVKQTNINRMINSDLINNDYGNINSAKIIYSNLNLNSRSKCYLLEFTTTSKEICYENDIDNKIHIISYDDYEFVLPEDASITDLDIKCTNNNCGVVAPNGIVKINIPIVYEDKNYDIKVVYLNN